MNAATVRETPYLQLVEERNALARALWAYRVIGRAYAAYGLCRGEWLLSDTAACEAADSLVEQYPSLGEGIS